MLKEISHNLEYKNPSTMLVEVFFFISSPIMNALGLCQHRSEQNIISNEKQRRNNQILSLPNTYLL